MKICLLNDAFPPVIDGVANVVANYAKFITSLNLGEPLVGTPYYPDADYSEYPFPVITYLSASTEAIASGYRAGYPFALREIARMAEFQPEIIHTHCPFTSCMIARNLREVTQAPVVLTYHTKYDIDIRKAIRSEFLQKESIHAVVHNISACDEVWTVSRGAGENLKSLGYEGTYTVVENGVDFEKGRVDDAAVHEALRDYDLPEDVPVFLFIGRMMNYKGLPMIADAVKMLSDEGIDYRMVFVGGGTDAQSIYEKVKGYHLNIDSYADGRCESVTSSSPGKVIFAGPVSDRNLLRIWNSRADLFIFPSTFDTNGLVVREAAACGLASVLIKDSAAAEGVSDGRNGFLIDENAEALASFLKYACGYRDFLHQAGQHAMDEIYLSWNDAVRKAVNLYADLIYMKKCGLLKQRKPLADDPLYEMSAAAIRHCQHEIHVMNRKTAAEHMPAYEGMLDNIAVHAASLADSLYDGIEDVLGFFDNLNL